jgi:UPF0176 protein
MFVITTFYKFVELTDLEALRFKLYKFCNDNKIKGTILIAKEGVNSTITGTRQAIDGFYQFVKSIEEIADLTFKESYSEEVPFKKLKVKIRKEIVTFGVDLDMSQVGKHLSPAQWDEVISREDAIVIDTRNDYEIVFGTFENAIDPKTRNFTDLIEWVDKNLTEKDKNKPVAMFCTGGVRCEKSTAFMLKKGFKEVYHLDGGILSYFEKTKNASGKWKGRCFVFDDRIAVDPELNPYCLPKNTDQLPA